jgi:hypothetical protein
MNAQRSNDNLTKLLHSYSIATNIRTNELEKNSFNAIEKVRGVAHDVQYKPSPEKELT